MTIVGVGGLVSDPNRAFDGSTTPVNVPSGLAVGDLIYVPITFTNAQTDHAAVNCAGFTEMGLSGVENWAFWKIADSGDVALSGSAGVWTFNCSDGFVVSYAVYAWRGVNPSSPFLTGPTVTTNSVNPITLSSQPSNGYWVGSIETMNNSGGITTNPSVPTLLEYGIRTGFGNTASIYEVPSYTSGTSYADATEGTAGWSYYVVTFLLNPAGGGGGGGVGPYSVQVGPNVRIGEGVRISA